MDRLTLSLACHVLFSPLDRLHQPWDGPAEALLNGSPSQRLQGRLQGVAGISRLARVARLIALHDLAMALCLCLKLGNDLLVFLDLDQYGLQLLLDRVHR